MISNLAVVNTSQIGDEVEIREFCVVRNGVVIGDNVVIHPHVVIEPGVIIGSNVEIFPGTYIGKTPKGVGATTRQISFESRVVVGDHCAIGPNAVIFYDVEIGNNTLVGDGASLREGVKVGHHCILSRHVTVNYNTNIGNHTRIMDLTHITGNSEIGDNVFISVLVSTTNDNAVIDREYNGSQMKGPWIKNGATIGAGACLLPGVEIGEGAFVGTNAVVTRHVQPYNLVMGIPAKVKRELSQRTDE